ncbi:uncharacterized protein LOC134250234 [Saccostrea cucullata]|uniref:uncharacterized protein LOC134250234 n=1 Tax=Saccostrea cuccullata TaxID=36930 RepID=UPI002ED3846E
MESGTPQKLVPLSSCLLCASSTRRLHSFTQNKAINEKYLETVEAFLGIKLQKNSMMAGLKICETCFKKCSSALAFKKDALITYKQQIESMERTKRLSKTPPSALKKNTVVENLLNSVEKLKRLKLSKSTVENTSSSKDSKARKCLMSFIDEPENQTLPSPCFPDRLFDHGYTRSLGGVEDARTSCDSKVKPDHDYCTNTEDSETKDNDDLLTSISAINSYTLSDELVKLDTQLKKLCHPGASVLWQRNPEVLMNDNCFAKAVIELKCSCPLLLDVLATCLGQYICDENKVVMIGTIYGMILHARNKKISAVQRIYTALAIQYHADNKCSFQYLHHKLLKYSHIMLEIDVK